MPKRVMRLENGKEQLAFWLLCLPAILIYFFVMIVPLVGSFLVSMTSGLEERAASFSPISFVGGKNYNDLILDSDFWLALRNNLAVIGVLVLAEIPIGLLLAYILYRRFVAFPTLWQVLFYLPVMISPIVLGLLWKLIFHTDHGPITTIGQVFFPPWKENLITDPHDSILPLLLVVFWKSIGLYLLIFLAKLNKIDYSIIEAAKLDGASEAQILRHIILPYLSRTIMAACIIAIISSLQMFSLVFAMTEGEASQSLVLVSYLYKIAFQGKANYGLASAVTVVIIVITCLLILFVAKKKQKRYKKGIWSV